MNVYELTIDAILIGSGATVCMDLWGLFQTRVLKIPVLNYAMVGRWIGHLPGKIVHEAIGKAQPIPGEMAIGWAAHYLIGIGFAGLMLLWVGTGWAGNPTFFPALVTGIVTLAAPFFILQPCMGAGIAASKTPAPNTARLRSLITHLVFGTGLYVTAMLLGWVGLA